MRARLDREHGSHANQLIWEGPIPIVGDVACNQSSLIAMDQWLSAIEQDSSSAPIAQKIVQDKPANLSDACWDGLGNRLSGQLCGGLVVSVYGTPRTVAGDAITTDANKCQRIYRETKVLTIGGGSLEVMKDLAARQMGY